MSYYEANSAVIGAMSDYLKAHFAAKGFDVSATMDQYHSITNAHRGSYVSSLLFTNIPKRDKPIFANTPYVYYMRVVGDNLEEIFGFLGLPSTQKQLATMWQRLKHSKIENIIDVNKLLEFHKIKTKIQKDSEWFIEARSTLVAMYANLPLLDAVTEEEKEFSKLLDFDWYYSYSDNAAVYKAGEQIHNSAVVKINAALEKNPELIKVIKAVVANNAYITVDFFTKIYK